ncbi:valine--tRNA ligase [Peptococcus simiae]|uniref:Valine--tRNA ligase n=1 Tax=Peptococcus simiae TaxID=1643805 RepID=A0ABW9GZA0_9FIRM
MARELAKAYDPSAIEEKWYDIWEKAGYFKPSRDEERTPFTIVMPPPNVTGRLHMGHAMDNTMQDILIRYHRLKGDNTLWVPGTDHAGIATQAKVEGLLREEGSSKDEIGREAFIDRCWQWKNEYGEAITRQIRKLGSSCDWSMERFTMDDVCTHAVRKSFADLYHKGLIYQGDYIVNWCPHCETTISDIEVEHEDHHGQLYYLNYYTADGSQHVTIATTRPETIFGDVAIAVHPEDDRFSQLIGQEVLIPLADRAIPIIADDYVDKEFGTGALKITPSHDVNDFAVGQRHNLPFCEVIDAKGYMTDKAGAYAGLDRFDCRKKIIQDLEGTKYLHKVEDYDNAVGHCYRCHTAIEPRVSKQWFVAMEKLVKPALEAAYNGDIKFVPERFTKIYTSWLENIRDWCISRQLWWGHRIPVWTCQECGHIICEAHDPDTCPTCGSKKLHQDEDVLDTWFSSGLWPFEVLGWPEKTADLDMFYPTSVLVTGRDIIFFWVARMIFDAYELTGQKPFDDVLIHGLVLDDQGRKMSKSLGNGIDPLEEIERYGADALRMTLVTGTTPGNDTRYRQEKIEASRNFTNKLWNAARFVLMNQPEDQSVLKGDFQPRHLYDRWIATRLAKVAVHVSESLDHYELGEATRAITDFIWDEFCDWYIELAKPRLYGKHGLEAQVEAQQASAIVLREALLLLHPIMPFITEEIWQQLPHEGESIMIADWPQIETWLDDQAEADMTLVMDAVKAVRGLRHDMNVPTGKRAPIHLVITDPGLRELFEDQQEAFQLLAFASDVKVGADNDLTEQAVSAVTGSVQILLPIKELLNLETEIARMEKEEKRLQGEIKRLEGKLNNQGFVTKAPAEVVDQEREKLTTYKGELTTVEDRLDMLRNL